MTDPADFDALARTLSALRADDAIPLPRPLSLTEIAAHVLPMAPEHLRRVLAAHPDLPQGQDSAGETRRFVPGDIDRLRDHFAAAGARGRVWRPLATGPAPLIALADPGGGSGRSTTVANLATLAGLMGWRVLVIDADPGGDLARQLGAEDSDLPRGEGGVIDLFARDCGDRLVLLNEARLDRGDAPLPLDEGIASALDRDPAGLVRATVWPGVAVMTPPPMTADLTLAAWMRAARGWMPWRAIARELDRSGLRARFDLVLCDTGRGLGPLALSVLAAADALVVPVRAPAAAGRALAALAAGLREARAEARQVARMLGPAGRRGLDEEPRALRALRLLPAGLSDPAGFARLAGVAGAALLPAGLPALPGDSRLPLFPALDPRRIGRRDHALLWQAMAAAWEGFAAFASDLRAQTDLPRGEDPQSS